MPAPADLFPRPKKDARRDTAEDRDGARPRAKRDRSGLVIRCRSSLALERLDGVEAEAVVAADLHDGDAAVAGQAVDGRGRPGARQLPTLGEVLGREQAVDVAHRAPPRSSSTSSRQRWPSA